MKNTILVVDDDKKTAGIIQMYLEQAQFNVIAAYDGREALDQARAHSPDLIVLDIMMPRVDGLDVCRILRAESDVPIIILTARSTEDDLLLGLDLGADDYITKPFSPREVVARVRTVLRRLDKGESTPNEELRFGDLVILQDRHEVRIGGEAIRLTPKEFKLLITLATVPGKVFSRQHLIEQAFGYDYLGMDRTIDAHIMNLRKKIEPDHTNPIYLLTVFGIGYRFAEVEYVP